MRSGIPDLGSQPRLVAGGTKYSRVEYERRFLVDSRIDWRACVKPWSKLLVDRYLACGRLRLRRMEDIPSGRVTFKLTKKYESESPRAQPIVTILLSRSEYDAFHALPGFNLSKQRYYDERADALFGVDVFYGELEGLVLCEAEVESAADLANLTIPGYALQEVTDDRLFSGGSLCRASRAELTELIAGNAPLVSGNPTEFARLAQNCTAGYNTYVGSSEVSYASVARSSGCSFIRAGNPCQLDRPLRPLHSPRRSAQPRTSGCRGKNLHSQSDPGRAIRKCPGILGRCARARLA
jgi:CYTH domain-containing protein